MLKLPEETENALKEVRALNGRISNVIKFKFGEQSPSKKEVKEISRMHCPGLEPKVRNVLRLLVDETLLKGHSSDMDRLKDEMFGVLGRTTGEAL